MRNRVVVEVSGDTSVAELTLKFRSGEKPEQSVVPQVQTQTPSQEPVKVQVQPQSVQPKPQEPKPLENNPDSKPSKFDKVFYFVGSLFHFWIVGTEFIYLTDKYGLLAPLIAQSLF